MNKSVVAMILIWGLVVIAKGTLVPFELLENDAFAILDNKVSGSITNGGIIAMLTASEGVFNRTTSGFGINDIGSDDTDALNKDQFIDILFDQDINFWNVNVSSWGSGSAGDVRLGTSYSSQGNIVGTGDTTFNFNVASGQVVRIYATDETSPTNGFSLDSFTVEAIPEPAVLSFIGLSGLGLLIARRCWE